MATEQDCLVLWTGCDGASALAEMLAPGLSGGALRLPSAVPIAQGATIGFVVHLSNGATGLEGAGSCIACVEYETPPAPEHRFEVVIDKLSFTDRTLATAELIARVHERIARETGTFPAAVRPAEAREVLRVAIVGTGRMGAGIAAALCADARVEVVLRDVDDLRALQGLERIHDVLEARAQLGRLTRDEHEAAISRVTLAAIDDLAFVDLVIEAVFEDVALKREVLRDAERWLPPDAVFASNTSCIPIASISEGCARPERVVGMHFFSPAERTPLVEVIASAPSSPESVATCTLLAKRLGRAVIVVGDTVGFYTSRTIAPYLHEGAFILEEGAAPEQIDRALVAWGFAVGPLTVLDEIGLDTASSVAESLHAAFGHRLAPPRVLTAMCEGESLGRKSGRGFFDYGGEPVSGRFSILPKSASLRVPADSIDEDSERIAMRCVLRMINEAALCYSERVVRSARDADTGAMLGSGFPPSRGGPFAYVDSIGADKIVEQLEAHAAVHGARFAPAPILVAMARLGRKFYSAQADSPRASRRPSRMGAGGSREPFRPR